MRCSDVTAMHKECIYRIATSILNALAHEKRGRILRLCIIYEVLNIAVRSNPLCILYVKMPIGKA